MSAGNGMDEPTAFPTSVLATASLAVVRFHQRQNDVADAA